MASGGRDGRKPQPPIKQWGWKTRIYRKTSVFEGKSMPAPRPGDAPHRLCQECWIDKLYM